MYLFLIKLIFIYFMCYASESLELNEKEAEFVKINGTQSLIRKENFWGLLREQPTTLAIELKTALLEKLKSALEDEINIYNSSIKTTLITFDSLGLQEISAYNDTLDLQEALTTLEPKNHEKQIFIPTFHIINDLLLKNQIEGSLLLVTMSTPSDIDFKNLSSSLGNKKFQLSVLWAGDYDTDEYLMLKKLTEKTGGNFGFLTNEYISAENSMEEFFPKTDFESFSQQIKFPESQRSGEEDPLVSRAAENQRVIQKTVIPLIVEVASGTSLEARPGTPTQIQFQVKNNLNMGIVVTFNAKFNGIMQNVQPAQTLLPPSTTVTVIVNLQPIGITQSANAVGTLTLHAIVANKVTSRSALIFLTPQAITDNYAPKITHKYEGDCSNYKDPQTCENGHWTLEATVHDEESGLLKILSEPYGLVFQSEFVAGMKSPVTVYYTATCCQPYAIIWAEDLKGNYVKKSFDVFNQNLLASEIASIVLGVLIILFIIIGVLVAIVLIKRRNQRNLIIPRPRSGSR